MSVSCSIRERLHVKLVESGSAVISRPMDWRALGVPEWLADRAERLGFLFPTGQWFCGRKSIIFLFEWHGR